MRETVAEGVIPITVTDEGAIASLRRVSATFKREMEKISHERATATIDAQIEPFEKKLAKAKRRLRELKGERASARIDADTSELDRKILIAERRVKRLDGQKATVEIDVDGDRRALAQMKRVSDEREKMARAEDRYRQQTMSALNKDARQRASLERQRVSELKQSEAAAYKVNENLNRGSTVLAKQRLQIVQLKQEFLKLTDEAERMSGKHAFTAEGRVRLELQEAGIRAKMEAVKAQLNLLGSHPPVEIKIDTDKKDTTFLRRRMNQVKGIVGTALEKISRIGDIRIMGNSLRMVAGVIAGLSPFITSLVGSLTALTGVLGTGIVGAAAAAGGVLSGLALNIAGIGFALRPAIQDFKVAQQVTQAYQKAVLKYGEGSKQANKAQAQMNSALKGVNPLAAQAAKGLAELHVRNQKLTAPTRKNFGEAMASGFKTMNALLPTLARNTNETSRLVSNSMKTMFAAMRGQAGRGELFDSLGKSANRFLAPALDGVMHFGAGLAHVAESAARLFGGKMGNAIERWGSGFEKANQAGGGLDAKIQRLGNHAADVLHLFGSFGRLLGTVFNRGADSGDRMVKSMSKWAEAKNKFFHTDAGEKRLTDFFNRTEQGTRGLVAALGPIARSFLEWSAALAPVAAGFAKVLAFVSRAVGAVTHLAAMRGPLAALGGTIAAIFAIGKIGGFIAKTAELIGLLKTVRSLSDLKGVFGRLGKGGAMGAQIEAASAAGAAEFRAAIISGATVGAAALRAAEVEGGAMAAAEQRTAGGVILPGAASRSAGAAETAGASAVGANVGKLGAISARLATVGRGLLARAGWIAAAVVAWSTFGKQIVDLPKKLLGSIPGVGGKIGGGIGRIGGDAAKFMFGGIQGKIDATKDALGGLKDAWDSLFGSDDTKDPFKGLKEGATDATKSVKDLTKSLIPQITAENKAATSAINLARELAGMPALAGAAQQAVGQLAQKDPKIAKKISLKFEAPQDAARVAREATRSIQSGVKAKSVLSVVANSKNAEDAVRRLNALTIKAKLLRIVGNGEHARKAVETLAKMNLSPKTLRIIGNAADAVKKHGAVRALPQIAKVLSILGHNTAARAAFLSMVGLSEARLKKTLHIYGDVGPAMSAIRAVQGAVNALHGKNITNTVTTVHQQHGGFAGGAFATGGEAHADQMRKANEAAMAFMPQKTNGGKYSKPAFLIGEEKRPEFVIATNPAYRDDNLRYLHQAARALGAELVPAYKSGKGHKVHKAKKPSRGHTSGPFTAPDMDTRIPGIDPSSRIGPVEFDDLEGARDKAKSDYEKIRDRNKKYDSALRSYHKKSHSYKKHHHAPKDPDKHSRKQKKAAATYQAADHTLVQAMKFHNRFVNLETDIDTLATRMSTASRRKDWRLFTDLRGQRGVKLGRRKNLLTAAFNDMNRVAHDDNVDSKLRMRIVVSHYMAALNNALGIADDDIVSNEQSYTDPEQTDIDFAADSTKQFMDPKALGQLNALQAALASAQVNDVPDDPATSDNEAITSLKDNIAPQQALVDFYKGAYGRFFDSSGKLRPGVDPAAAASVAQAYKGSLDDKRALSDTITGATAEQAGQYTNFSSARADLYKSFGSNAASWGPVPSLGSQQRGYGGAGANPAAYGAVTNVTVNNTFPTPPADPHTFSSGLNFELNAILP